MLSPEKNIYFHSSVYLNPKHHFYIKYIRRLSPNAVKRFRHKGILRTTLNDYSTYLHRVHAYSILAGFFSRGDELLDELHRVKIAGSTFVHVIYSP